MRYGCVTRNTIDTFRALDRPIATPEGIVPTELFPCRDQVTESNWTRLDELDAPCQTYLAKDGGSLPQGERRQKTLEKMMAPARLTVKVGAQVMLIKNLDDNLANGTMGRVLGFSATTCSMW